MSQKERTHVQQGSERGTISTQKGGDSKGVEGIIRNGISIGESGFGICGVSVKKWGANREEMQKKLPEKGQLNGWKIGGEPTREGSCGPLHNLLIGE